MRHIWRASNNATQRASADAGAFDGVFFTGRWWPFFVSITQARICEVGVMKSMDKLTTGVAY
ncbi:hypothetical protein, partial [Escherichia coli]|uniref:hypothetical protein n=1 Tax=Escherichia coli TaxID=562 RepID=UPI003BA35C1F